MHKSHRIFYLLLLVLQTNFFSCKEGIEDYSTNPQHLLAFSADTLSFDTVLTTVNSPVQFFRVYNRNPKSLLIASVHLFEGVNSDFKINVDGRAGAFFENIEIRANDSLLVLVDVKPKENGKYEPALFNDYVVFETHNIQQKVVLEAYGQDVYTRKGLVISSDSLLDNQKPYLIYDSLVIGAGATVEISEGTTFYMHNHAQLIVRGTVKIKGSLEKPVVFRGSRTDNMITIPYDLIPGQWGGIRFASESYANEMENVRIRNGRYGMDFEISDPSRSKIRMKNLVLTNVSGALIQAVNCNITAENCEFSNAKNALLHLTGGVCRFIHCTIANYYPYHPELGWANSNHETLILTDTWQPETDSPGEPQYFPIINAEFFNTIIGGGHISSTSGIRIENRPEAEIAYFFKNCMLPNKGSKDEHFVDCLFQVEPLFKKTDPNDWEKERFHPTFDFGLQKDSKAKDAADIETANQIPYDLKGVNRFADGKPDLGAYEYQEEEP